MPRFSLRFPSKDQRSSSPPPVPPKSAQRKVSPGNPPTDTLRARRVTSPTTPSYAGPLTGVQPSAPKHRASASDSLAQGSGWRGISIPFRQSGGVKGPIGPVPVRPSPAEPPAPVEEPAPTAHQPRRQLRRSKGHQPIADEIHRRESKKTAEDGQLQEQAEKLKKEINEETIRLTQLRQKQKAIREERKKVEKERESQSQTRLQPQSQSQENMRPTNVNTAGINMPKVNNINGYHPHQYANPYGKSQSTPALPQTEWTPYNHPNTPLRGRSTAQSRESFQSASSQEQDFRRVWSRTPSMSSNDRSPPPQSTHTSYSPPSSSHQHWQKLEQARREREKEKAVAKLREAREMERKAFEEAWSVYDSRWMLLNYATRATGSSMPEETKGIRLTLSFVDIPWPLLHPPRTSRDINSVAIRRFFASEYQTASDRSPRERIKDALLRWHPDRFSNRVLDHVREGQREEVRRGVDIVVRCLNELLAKY
ncbi:hypothetical protein FRC14_006451 [Serendipita sp. 396]|nr:hypothetical protein FRC14_006451 [Serendipita sp. 396]KAG8787878.1 hypothetical protein FRC15_007387 [Serendipita sp. 397]KAG8802369.1 hypothetical protein FRC16_009812 [Serendipita sp. 398]KAG8871811.1 hypothetical protein FRC20_010147 [Serendipita sp. 405]